MTAEHPGDRPALPQRQSLRNALQAAALELEQQPVPPALADRALAALRPAAPASLTWRRPVASALLGPAALPPEGSGPGIVAAAAAPGRGWVAPWRLWFKPWAWPAAASLALVLLLSVAVTLMLPPPQRDSPMADLALPSGFVPVANAEALQLSAAALQDQAMPAWLVATEMPRERLGLLGLPFDPTRAGENVRAELLMHGSGAVLAVRVVAQ